MKPGFSVVTQNASPWPAISPERVSGAALLLASSHPPFLPLEIQRLYPGNAEFHPSSSNPCTCAQPEPVNHPLMQSIHSPVWQVKVEKGNTPVVHLPQLLYQMT